MTLFKFGMLKVPFSFILFQFPMLFYVIFALIIFDGRYPIPL